MTIKHMLAVALVAACAPPDTFPLPDSPPGQQGTSLLGVALVPDTVGETNRDNLDAAHAEFLNAPDDADAQVWLGRRFAYAGYHRTAIDIFTDGFTKHPDDARFLRHRGHRYISVRELDAAIEDLALAAKLQQGKPDEVEPDGQPNERGIPTSTLQSNIWYHLGLAHYLKGDFPRALSSYDQDAHRSRGPDGIVGAGYWLYMIHRRMGNDAEAAAVLEPITADMDIIENHAYHRLLLMFKGEISVEEMLESASGDDGLQNATVGYGIGTWFLMNGDHDRAFEIFNEILSGPTWASFGYIAAEAEVARRRAG